MQEEAGVDVGLAHVAGIIRIGQGGGAGQVGDEEIRGELFRTPFQHPWTGKVLHGEEEIFRIGQCQRALRHAVEAGGAVDVAERFVAGEVAEKSLAIILDKIAVLRLCPACGVRGRDDLGCFAGCLDEAASISDRRENGVGPGATVTPISSAKGKRVSAR